MSKLRIAIIGAGPCGLSQLLAFQQAEQEQRVELVCFERQSDWGGLWIYTSLTGNDAHGEPVHSSMYRQLWSNNPKESIEFADYTFHDHFGCFLPSYLPRALVYDYFIGRAKAGNIRRFIRFNTAIRHVDFNDEKQEFDVDVEDLTSASTESLKFDRVIVATGHYHVPNMTHIDGVDQFPGRVLHSHEFRGADEFVGQHLLILGGSFSAIDIALQCYKYGARSVTISSRQEPMGLKWPNEVKDAPRIVRMQGRTAHFKDHSTVDNIDAIIMCTGYRHCYPFMAKRFHLHGGITEFVPPNLYKGVFWVNQPHLAYLGAQRLLFTFPLFDLQTALVRDVLLGHVKLPDEDQRQVDVDQWQAREKAISPSDFPTLIDFQTDYMRDIFALLSTYDGSQSSSKPDFDQANRVLKKFLESFLADIVHYRDVSFESIVDSKNKKTIDICKPWISNTDDSMEHLLNDYRKKS